MGAIFIMPRSSRDWVGSEAVWVTAAGWAAAARRKFGTAWVVTQDRIASPEEALRYPLGSPSAGQAGSKPLARRIPRFFKTWAKDILLWRKSRNWSIVADGPWHHHQVAFIWEQHDLFAGPGRKLAARLGVPLVKYVHAPVVWEARRWGVKRYLWGWFLERFVEAPALRTSDVVLCVSEQVAEKVRALGVAPQKVRVSPMAADPDLFRAAPGGLRKKLNVEGCFVFGWIGSFRSFHGLDQVVDAFARVHNQLPHARLCLVGDGVERPAIEERVKQHNLGAAVLFLGRKSFLEIPSYLSVFDVAMVSARNVEDFHYSPLKLREYLAAGRAVLGPRAGEIPRVFRENEHLALYEPGRVDELAEKMMTLAADADLRSKLAANGHKFVLETSTWDVELNKLDLFLRNVR
jgi:glycosyltransferase involved in cell wall biosynthesis